MTENGFCATVPAKAQQGDSIALLAGGTVPFITRQREDSWELIREPMYTVPCTESNGTVQNAFV